MNRVEHAIVQINSYSHPRTYVTTGIDLEKMLLTKIKEIILVSQDLYAKVGDSDYRVVLSCFFGLRFVSGHFFYLSSLPVTFWSFS